MSSLTTEFMCQDLKQEKYYLHCRLQGVFFMNGNKQRKSLCWQQKFIQSPFGCCCYNYSIFLPKMVCVKRFTPRHQYIFVRKWIFPKQFALFCVNIYCFSSCLFVIREDVLIYNVNKLILYFCPFYAPITEEYYYVFWRFQNEYVLEE